MTYTTTDGKTAIAVNPYKEYITADTGKCSKATTKDLAYADFERNNPPLPLTTERHDLKNKGPFEGEVVWQAKSGPFMQYVTYDKSKYPFTEFEDFREFHYDKETRQAISPKGESPFDENGDLNVGVIGKQLEKDIANMPDNGFRFEKDKVWNSAIDACVEKFRDWYYHNHAPGNDSAKDNLIQQLYSLRK